MSFQDQVALDMANVFLNTDEFAESIVYTTKAGVASTIPAVVDRQRINIRPEDQGRSLHKEAEITIQNDADNGVTTVDTRGDKVTFAPRAGLEAVDWDVLDVLEHSESHWRLLVTQ